ncbi:MAG TPA: asparagine synthetase B, partial [Planctomycetaceae bacterium]|nr:asparagine synthetase B [Planctomycetaceae bacterium]
SQIPTYLVSKLAREYVTVSLSGDGGDELFGGYQRYFHLGEIWKKLQKIPARKFSYAFIERLTQHVPNSMLLKLRNKLKFAAQIESPEELYAYLHRHWFSEEIMSQEVYDPSLDIGFGAPIPHLDLAKHKWMALDTTTYLPDDILTKVDRASMAVSLEVRVPMLDHHIIEFAWTLPPHYCYEGEMSKRILRTLLERYIPRKMFDRPKSGFGIPIGEWLRGSLRDWAEDLLSEKSLNEHGLLNTALIRSRWEEHCSGKQNSQYLLWDVLVFQQWYRATMST